MISELKAFIMRGDVLSLAVAVIIGGAFGKIVDSMVGDIITPILSLATQGHSFADSFKFGSADAPIKFGAFLQAIINFITVATVLFFVVKGAGKSTADVK
jgi:large conductance mechanosensitive channel